MSCPGKGGQDCKRPPALPERSPRPSGLPSCQGVDSLFFSLHGQGSKSEKKKVGPQLSICVNTTMFLSRRKQVSPATVRARAHTQRGLQSTSRCLRPRGCVIQLCCRQVFFSPDWRSNILNKIWKVQKVCEEIKFTPKSPTRDHHHGHLGQSHPIFFLSLLFFVYAF